MNRRERRLLERQGKLPKREPVYTMKPSDIKEAALNGAAREAMIHEINQQCLAIDNSFTLDMDTMVLFTLHTRYGWGKKRLKDFYQAMFDSHLAMRECYDTDEAYPERIKLKEKGIDVEAWYSKLFNSDGTYKRPEEVNWDDE